MAGIFIPSVCVIDLEAFVKSLAADAIHAGAQFFYGREVTGISVRGSSYAVQTKKEEFNAHALINSAGLHAHTISSMAGIPRYEVDFIRGDYYELIGGINRWQIRTLVYPAMPPGSRSKGIHFGPRTDGRLYIGPSATTTIDQAPKQLFIEAAQRFIPEISEDDLRWAYAGTRPKNKFQDGSDFIIRLDRTIPPLINLIGIDSPGLSSAMAIAQYVADILSQAGLEGPTSVASHK
jgi:glycerol-3-phosphate dehydrogenase